MIETRGLPVALNVALGAVLTHRTAVRIILTMAAQTVVAQSLADCALGMTQPAFDLGVGAEQPESGESMIEIRGGLPAARGVAIATAIAQFRLMAIVLVMAGHTAGVGLAMLLAGGVAATALGGLVFAGQRKIGECVIEGALIKADDARVCTQMLAVAVDAALARLAPVQAVPALNIAGDLLVAIQAQLRLLFLVEGRVAAFALGLVGLVPPNHFPGHQRTFQQARFGASTDHGGGQGHQPHAPLKSTEKWTQITLSD